jgi:hypothetical protein
VPSFLISDRSTDNVCLSLQATYSRLTAPRREFSVHLNERSARSIGRFLLDKFAVHDVARILGEELSSDEVAQIFGGKLTGDDIERAFGSNLTTDELARILSNERIRQKVARNIAKQGGLSAAGIPRHGLSQGGGLGYGRLGRDAVLVGELTSEARLLASCVVIAHFATIVTGDPGALRDYVESRTAFVRTRRVRYESPLELALLLPPAIFAVTSGLTALIFGLKRMYAIDLEFRTHREEHRAAFLEAKRHAEEAERARQQGGDPEFWPPGMLEAIYAVVVDKTKSEASSLKAVQIVLVEEDENDPEDGGKADHTTA